MSRSRNNKKSYFDDDDDDYNGSRTPQKKIRPRAKSWSVPLDYNSDSDLDSYFNDTGDDEYDSDYSKHKTKKTNSNNRVGRKKATKIKTNRHPFGVAIKDDDEDDDHAKNQKKPLIGDVQGFNLQESFNRAVNPQERGSVSPNNRSRRPSPRRQYDDYDDDNDGFFKRGGHGSLSSGSSGLSSSLSASSTRSTHSHFSVARNSTGSVIAVPHPRGSIATISSAPKIHLVPSHPSTPKPSPARIIHQAHPSPSRSPLSSRPALSSYDRMIRGPVANYVQASAKIGPDVLQQAKAVQDLFKSQRAFLASNSNNNNSTTHYGDHSDAMYQVRHVSGGASSKHNQAHLRLIAETVGALDWVMAQRDPGTFVRQSYARAQSQVKKVMGEGDKKRNGAWVKAWQEVILELEAFVDEWGQKY